MYKNKISIIGTGYVGLVAGVCLADFGNTIINVDIDEEKIEQLQNGGVPIYEPGLEDLLERNVEEGRISFTTDVGAAISKSEVIFIAVGTPPRDDGSADLSNVLKVAETIGDCMESYKVIVNKSTVPVGTGKRVEEIIASRLEARGISLNFDVVSNPEFLREGKAVYDFTHPDRIIIGTESGRARKILREVYRALYLNDVPFVFTNRETAEVIKYASNAFLATKISFINEMSVLCDQVGANVQQVARAMGMDGRIGDKFLHPGPGYGGSCFPKDTKAIVRTGEDNGVDMKVIRAGVEANRRQKEYMVEKIESHLDNLENKVIGVLGLSFKPETDDMRESPALTIIPNLIEKGAQVRAYDPQGVKEAVWRLQEYEKDIIYGANEYEVMKNAEALVLVTEWNQFRRLDLEKMRNLLANPLFFDLRNVYEPREVVEAGIEYVGVGVPSPERKGDIDSGRKEVAVSEE
ncbi:MAG: UDP-glucose dehydrogenase family protein [Halanaerobiales bacterium]